MTDWDQALCRGAGVDSDMFFDDYAPPALNMCSRCPVKDDCREYTHDLEQRVGRLDGVWGAMTREDRKLLWPLDVYAVKRVRAGIY